MEKMPGFDERQKRAISLQRFMWNELQEIDERSKKRPAFSFKNKSRAFFLFIASSKSVFLQLPMAIRG
jgi:hypothetical protein